MRTSVRHALSEAPQPDELDSLGATLRGHIAVLIPDVEKRAGKEPKGSVARNCALACVGEATRKLRLGDGAPHLPVRLSVVEKLARSVGALCDHYENLGNRTA
ncbi:MULTISPECIES: DUF6415 family natural product biosynthesis protein [unclassified Streptomyces]|uniref:DUF6415 family natural product biosynthesis protein n=1 Tax=unclassified Streptomyces TaxID=2593676 RepID=UPI0036E3B307